MILGLEKKVAKVVLRIIDETIGKRFPIIDKITDMFQEQDGKLKELQREIDAIKFILKDKDE
tara:strand:- start:1141 stop:1326 length:186 start_codon:yes stop_codon:yes gene_type:complete